MLDKILSVSVTFLPLAGAAVCIFLFCRGAEEAAVARNARWTALCGPPASCSCCRC